MKKSTKWTLLGLGIISGVLVIATISYFISLAVVLNAMENLSNTIAEGVKKEIPEALTEPEIREIIREEITEIQSEEEITSDETSLTEEKEITGEEGISEELDTGHEFIYQGKKIVLTKYEFVQESLLTDDGEKLLYVYLYVENIDNVSHNHTYDYDFVIYHQDREVEPLMRTILDEDRESYDIGEYNELNPGEICEGWTFVIIPLDWKADDVEIHFKPLFGETKCIWLLK